MSLATCCQEYRVGLHRETIPARSALRPDNNQARPMRSLASREDDCGEQWECLQRWLLRLPRPAKVPVVEMIRAYEEATGTFISCD